VCVCVDNRRHTYLSTYVDKYRRLSTHDGIRRHLRSKRRVTLVTRLTSELEDQAPCGSGELGRAGALAPSWGKGPHEGVGGKWSEIKGDDNR